MNKKDFNVILEEINGLRKQISEAYMLDDMEQGMDDEMEMGDEPHMPMYQDMSKQGMGDSEEEKAMHAQEVIKHEPIIAKIREIAIEGLKKYSDYPTSDLYDFFKRVFLLADKTITSEGNNK